MIEEGPWLSGDDGCLDRIDLEVRARNRNAQRFCRDAGFAPGKTIPGYQGQEAAMRMHKWLDSVAR